MGFSFEEKRFEDRLGGVLREEGSGAMGVGAIKCHPTRQRRLS